jgi:hypothetical protein
VVRPLLLLRLLRWVLSYSVPPFVLVIALELRQHGLHVLQPVERLVLVRLERVVMAAGVVAGVAAHAREPTRNVGALREAAHVVQEVERVLRVVERRGSVSGLALAKPTPRAKAAPLLGVPRLRVTAAPHLPTLRLVRLLAPHVRERTHHRH